MNTGPGSVFTTLLFLRNLRMGPKSKTVTLHWAKLFSSDKHTSLFGAFVSYLETEVQPPDDVVSPKNLLIMLGYFMFGTVSLSILLAKWMGGQCFPCTWMIVLNIHQLITLLVLRTINILCIILV